MHFRYSDEQRAFRDTIRRYLTENCTFEARRRAINSDDGWSREVWRQLAGLGVLGLTLPEEVGGLGGGAVERMIVAEELGRVIAPEPYLASVVLGGRALMDLGTPAQQETHLAPMIAGEHILAVALHEPTSGDNLHSVVTTATQGPDGWQLQGAKSLVWHGGSADTLIVSARISGGQTDAGGIGLFLVNPVQAGVQRQSMQTQDGQRMAQIRFTDAVAEALGTPGEAGATLAPLECDAIAMLSAEAVGAMEAALWQTVDYLKIRTQFGTPLAGFQVLQHRAAELVTELEQARSMAIYAAMSDTMPLEQRIAASAAVKVLIGDTARHIGQAVVQMHGGIGVTMENGIGHYFKRLEVISQAFGNAERHLRRLMNTQPSGATGRGLQY